MSELERQKTILKLLKKEHWIKSVVSEKPYLFGNTDIFAETDFGSIGIEIKLKLNSRLFEQLNKQKNYFQYLIAIAEKPKREETLISWKKIAKQKSINLLFFDEIEEEVKRRFNASLVKNPWYVKEFYERFILNG